MLEETATGGRVEGWVHCPAVEAEKSVLPVVVRAQSHDLRVAHRLPLLEILTWNKGYQEAEFFLFTMIEAVTSGCGDATGARAGFQDTAAEAVAPCLQPALAPGGTFWPAHFAWILPSWAWWSLSS